MRIEFHGRAINQTWQCAFTLVFHFISISRIRSISFFKNHLIDIHHRVTRHNCGGTIATTKDVTDACEGTDIDSWRLVVWITLSITIRNTIRSCITAAIKFTDNDWCTTIRILLDIHFDGATNTTTRLITAEHTSELTTGQCQADIVTHIRLLCTRIDGTNPVVRHTA